MTTPSELYIKFSAEMRGDSIEKLVERYHRELGNKGWNGARGAYLVALRNEFLRRGVDISVIASRTGMYLRDRVFYSRTFNMLLLKPE